MKSSSKPIQRFLKDPNNILSTIMGVIITALTMLFRNLKIPMWILGVFCIISIIVIWILLYEILLLKENDNKCIKPINWYPRKNDTVLIIDDYSFLTTDALVTIYIVKEIEEYFGTGIILPEQTTKGCKMIKIMKTSKYYKDNQLPEISCLVIRPVLSLQAIKEE